MLSFNKRAVAITGLTYQNQKFGPTIVYKKYDESGSWKLEVARELKAAGFSVDANKLIE